MKKQEKINIISTLLLIGFCLSCYTHFVLVGSYKLTLPMADTFLFLPNDRFMDFFNLMPLVKGRSPYVSNDGITIGSYFPFAYFILYLLSFLSDRAAFFISTTLFIGSFLAAVVFFVNNKKVSLMDNLRNIFIITFITYPFLFTLDRGNLESFIFIFELLFIVFYLKNFLLPASFFLACAAAMKVYPIILSVIFLADRKYKEFRLAILFSILLAIAPIFLFKETFVENVLGFVDALKSYSELYVFQCQPDTNGSSIITIIKIFYGRISGQLLPMGKNFFIPFIAFCLFSYSLICYYIIKFKVSLWKQSMLLLSLIIILFNCSYDYKLICLTIPMLLFVNDESKDKYSVFYSIGFALLLMPKQILVNIPPFQKLHLSNLINFVVISAFIWLIIRSKVEPRIKSFT